MRHLNVMCQTDADASSFVREIVLHEILSHSLKIYVGNVAYICHIL